jgi:hypothetical protein
MSKNTVGMSEIELTISPHGVQLASGVPVSSFSTDATLGANSDEKIPTEKAVKTYIASKMQNVWTSNNDGSGSGLDADLLDGYHANALPISSATQSALNRRQTKITANTTVNLNATMSAATIQGLINAVPKNLGTHTLTIKFGAGTYNLDNHITLSGFYNGIMYVMGNTVTWNMHDDQDTILDFTSNSTSGLLLDRLSAKCYVISLKLMLNPTASNVYGIHVETSPGYMALYYNYISGSVDTAGEAVHVSASGTVAVKDTYLEGFYAGIRSQYSSGVLSLHNLSKTNQPKYGLLAADNGSIGKSSSQPTGSVANEAALGGGVIR